MELAAGERGPAPSTVTFLSGDVHHSYVSEARPARHERELRSTILQAVCSPIRNPLSRNMRFATAVLSYGVAGPVGRLASKSARVPDPPLTWRYAEGPWFDNNLACLQLDGPSLRMWWVTGEVIDDHERPRLAKVATYALDDQGRPPPPYRVPARIRRGVRRRVRAKLVDRVDSAEQPVAALGARTGVRARQVGVPTVPAPGARQVVREVVRAGLDGVPDGRGSFLGRVGGPVRGGPVCCL